MTKRSIHLWITAFVFICLIYGCGTNQGAPVAINENVDKCTTCNMQVVDSPLATEVLLKNGQVLKFDDIGCMYEWQMANPTAQMNVAYVRDFHTKEWIKREEAFYAHIPTIQTPMAYNVLAFKTKDAAQKMMEQEHCLGSVMTSADLDKHTWEKTGTHS